MKFEDALLNPSLMIQGNPNVLSRLYWSTLEKSGINLRTFNALGARYGKIFATQNSRTRPSEAVNNLKSVVVKRNLTWLQFLRGLYSLGGKRVVIILDLTRGVRGKPMTVRAEITLNVDTLGNRRGTVSTKVGTIQDALDMPWKHAKKASGALAYLFWSTYHHYDIPHKEWFELIRRYTLNPYNVPDQTAARRSEAKNNLVATLLNNTITWSQFLRGMRLLDIRTMGITVELHRESDVVEVTDRCDFKQYFEYGDQHGRS